MNVQSGRRRPSGAYRRILCPTSFSALAQVGVEQATQLAARSRAELVFLHVLPSPGAYAAPEIAAGVLVRFGEQWWAEAWAELRHLEDTARRAGLRVHGILVEGYAPERIAHVARRLRCDLIVLATHDRNGFLDAFHRGMAERVLRHAPCPVLVYRASRASSAHGHAKTPQQAAA